MRSFKLCLAMIFIFVFFLAGCKPDPVSISDLVELQATSSVDDTTTPVPTVAATVTPVDTSTATITVTSTVTPIPPTETITPSPTPFTGFNESSLNTSYNQGNESVLIFNVPGVSRDYYVLVNNYFGMSCSPSPTTADMLICVGSAFRLTTTSPKIYFYEDTAYTALLYSNYFYIPVSSGLVEPTKIPWIVKWAGNDTNCPNRGNNVTCETEYRAYPLENGGELKCFDASCFDACGYYYSVDNCPPSGNWIAIPRPAGPGWEPLDVIKQ